MNRALSTGRRSHLTLVQSDNASEAFAPSGRILSFLPLPTTLTHLDSISTESVFKLESSLSLNAELYITSIIALSLFETLLDASMLQRVSTSLIDKIFGNFFDNFGVLMSIIGLIEITDVLRRNKKYDLNVDAFLASDEGDSPRLFNFMKKDSMWSLSAVYKS